MYLRTSEGWLYLAVVIDLWSRAVISWSMVPRMTVQFAMRCRWRYSGVNARETASCVQTGRSVLLRGLSGTAEAA